MSRKFTVYEQLYQPEGCPDDFLEANNMNHPDMKRRSWTAPKTVTLPDFLTEAQLNRAQQCKSAKEVCEKVVTPHLKEIEEKCGQEMDPMYVSYMIEMVFRQAGIWR